MMSALIRYAITHGRLTISVLLFLLILFAHAMGWIQSTGIPVRVGG